MPLRRVGLGLGASGRLGDWNRLSLSYLVIKSVEEVQVLARYLAFCLGQALVQAVPVPKLCLNC
jgi:hypothetical protein